MSLCPAALPTSHLPRSSHAPPALAENEARAFAKSEGWETEDVEEIALRVRLSACRPVSVCGCGLLVHTVASERQAWTAFDGRGWQG